MLDIMHPGVYNTIRKAYGMGAGHCDSPDIKGENKMKKLAAFIMTAIIAALACLSFASCAKTGGETLLKTVPVALSNEQYAFAVKKGDAEMKNSVNAFFKAKADDISAIFEKYTADGADLTSFGDDTIKTTPTGADDELVVATNLDFAPFEYTNGKKIAGIDMEIAKLLADYLGKTLVVVNMEFDAVVTSLATKDEYDIGIAGLTITPDRAEMVDFTDPYFGAAQYIVVKKDDTTFDGLDTAEKIEAKLKELTGAAAKCGGQKATTSQFYVEGNADFGFSGFSNLKFSGYKSAALAANDMLNGNLAFVVVDEATAKALVSSITN